MRSVLCAVLSLMSAACLRTTEFHCSANSECGAQGVCAPMGLCSVVDTNCTSGLRYSDTAGSQANQCVGGNGGVDAAIDSPSTIDSAIDATSGGCPAGYNTLTGGQGTHRYRLLSGPDDWATQRAFCTATTASAYLAIPDDLAELNAIATLSGASHTWVGISDLATENTFVTVKYTPQTFLPWVSGAPDNGPPAENCVEIASATSTMNDERCNTQFVAVCECEP
jgi:hypothetical protein